MKPIRIYLAEESQSACPELKALLRSQPEIDLAEDPRNGLPSMNGPLEQRPEVAVVDTSSPGSAAEEVAKKLKQHSPDIKVLIVSNQEDPACLKKAIQAGARGYILKRGAADELVHAIQVIARGGVYVDPSLAERLVRFDPAQPTVEESAIPHVLSRRETEVVRLLAQGYTNKEIGVQMKVSVKSVETYKARALEKLGFRSRVDLVHFALKNGWLTENSFSPRVGTRVPAGDLMEKTNPSLR